MAEGNRAGPQPTLSVLQAVSIMVGIVVGIGIFQFPKLVALSVDSEIAFIAVWVAGGLLTLIGSLCYAELAATYPHAGGEYHFLSRAYGRPVGMLFGWARGSVIQTGSIALVAFVFGDYAQQIVPLGAFGSSLYAALAVVTMTGLNLLGSTQSASLQNLMTLLTIGALGCIVIAGFAADPSAAPTGGPPGPVMGFGMAMVFVLLTYGGWNEAAYLSAEVRDGKRNMVRVLVIGTAVLTTLYVVANLAYLKGLGLPGLRASDAIATDLMRMVLGPVGAIVVGLAVVAASLSTLNATIFTGARVYYAMARDLPLLPRIGDWSDQRKTPTYGLLLQAAVAMALIVWGALYRDGITLMVRYTSPVFWSFLLLVAVGLIVLRVKDPDRPRPFKVPLYPVIPGLFVLSCAYMLYSSLEYAGAGSWVGMLVVALGLPLVWISRVRERRAAGPASTPAE